MSFSFSFVGRHAGLGDSLAMVYYIQYYARELLAFRLPCSR